MTRTALWLVGLACLAAPGRAQDEAKPSSDPNVRLKELQAEQRQLFQEWRAKAEQARAEAEAAQAEGRPAPAIPMQPDMNALRDKYLAAAKEFAGDDAVQFLLPAFQMGKTPQERAAVLDTLLTDHIDSPQLRPLGRMFGYLDQIVGADSAAQARERVAKHCKDPVLLGWLAFGEHDKVLRNNPASAAAFQSAKTALLAAVEKANDQVLERAVTTLIAEQEKFGLGMTAPDIAGVDLDGVEFKLSDYKGKVVFLDFWGDW